MSKSISIFELTNKCLVEENSFVPFTRFLELGFYLKSDYGSESLFNHLKKKGVDYNSSFYKNWSTVKNTTDENRFIDQIMHYLSLGTYIPNGNFDKEPWSFEGLKVIESITIKEAQEIALSLVYSPKGLKQETINQILDVLSDVEIDVNFVKNKEALCLICKEKDIVPYSAEDCIRYVLYSITGKTLVINDQKTNYEIESCRMDLRELLERIGYQKLAGIYNRYKWLFLSVKRGNRLNAKAINKISKLSKRFHIPKPINHLETFVSHDYLREEIKPIASTFTGMQCVRLIKAIDNQKFLDKLFKIRNGKSFFKKSDENQVDYWDKRNFIQTRFKRQILIERLIEILAAKKCRVKLGKVDLACPVSEKMFIGHYPMGSSIDISKGSIVSGVYWGGNSARDIDLSFWGLDGTQISWNQDWKGSNILYSGDVIVPESSECLYASNGISEGVIRVSIYNGEVGNTVRLFIGQETPDNWGKNYMVNPNNILIEGDVSLPSKQSVVGVISNGRYYVSCFGASNSQVASLADDVNKHCVSESLNYLQLWPLLEKAGFTAVNEGEDFDFDLNLPNKAGLLNLFS